MSTDNWGTCPKCAAASVAAHKKAQLAADAAYGKVTPEKYLAMLEEAKTPVPFETTLREDYELGVLPDGKFYVHYGCSCSVCDFKFTFNHEAQVTEGAK